MIYSCFVGVITSLGSAQLSWLDRLPAQGFQLIGYHFLTIIDKHVHTFPEYQVLVHVSAHKCIREKNIKKYRKDLGLP